MATLFRQPDWNLAQIANAIPTLIPNVDQLFRLHEFAKVGQDRFNATIKIIGRMGEPDRVVRVSDATNAGMGRFVIEETEEVR